LPLLENVDGFVGVRIHAGNFAKDTDGCILPGTSVGDAGNFVLESKKAFEALDSMIEAALDSGEEVWLAIENAGDEDDAS
jgi:hypothetical protein